MVTTGWISLRLYIRCIFNPSLYIRRKHFCKECYFKLLLPMIDTLSIQ